ncbi:MAG: hypothetical protein GXX85_13080 [Ignavibacteria bacterium]|nr:hypothetical protein [Ignavibacteria bacterium]
MKLFKLTFLFVFAVLFNNISAQNFNDALRLSMPGLGTSARALSMGNSFVAQGDEFAGIYYNPAGIGFIKNLQISATVDYNSISNNVSFFNSKTKSSKNNIGLTSIGLVFPIPTYRGSMVFSAGYNKIKDFVNTNKFDGFNPNSSRIADITGRINYSQPLTYDLLLSYEVNDGNGNYQYDETILTKNLNQNGEITDEGSIGVWSFAGSVEIAKGLFFGGTMNIYSGDYEKMNKYLEKDTKNIYQGLTDPTEEDSRDFISFYLENKIKWELSGYDFKLGLIYQSNPFVKVGATVKFPTYYTIEESFSNYAESEFRDVFVNVDEEITELKYDIKTPYVFELGTSLTFFDLLVNGQISYSDYSQMKFTEGLDKVTRDDNNYEITDLFEGALNYNLGLEYNIKKARVKLRSGWVFSWINNLNLILLMLTAGGKITAIITVIKLQEHFKSLNNQQFF